MTTESSPREMATAYEPARVEQRLYEWWEANGFFQPSGPSEDGTRQPFTVIMPPPNVTGELHLGHALTTAIEDILVRWHRMRGDDTLWLPGVDHAAIAVQNVVERELRREGIERRDIGREEFLRHVWTWVHKTRDAIGRQHRRLGASADWTRERFTMDEGPQRAVRQTFVNLYNDGLIYRGERLINWCPDCGTALSDLEVEHADEPGSFWYVRYPVADDNGAATNDYIVIATTRPETIPADTAVAVHPEDDRYRHLIGRRVVVPTSARAIPVIADEAVSIEGGSGALKVTPGHDPVDFEIGQRHDLPVLTVIGLDARMTDAAGEYAGLDRFEARDRVVADLDARGLIEKIEPYTHSIGHCQRSGTIVEPLLSEQWFVRTEPLARPAIEAVRDGRIKFVPQRFDRTYFHWMENIRDWTISRQIWWGHRIPVWYCDDCAAMTLPTAEDPTTDPTACGACGSVRIRQDEDTLDTWFSSGLWPHSTLGWPDPAAEDLRRYYPTQVMETGYDIIFFWVARMIMLSLYNMDGVVPFETVYLHGLVRAPDGSKMSKSKGNTVDPLQLIDGYGTDALRYALISSTSPGNDQRITDQRVEAGRNLGNKLWNASRFVLTMVEDGDDLALPPAGATLPLEDRWILSRTERVVASVDELLGKFELGEAVRQARDFFWDEFADWYIEMAKVRIRQGDRSPVPVLLHVLDRVLRLLHPCMPFVTEEIWQRLVSVRPDPAGAPALIVAAYPKAQGEWIDDAIEARVAVPFAGMRAVRETRATKRIDPGRRLQNVAFELTDEAAEDARAMLAILEALTRAEITIRPMGIESTEAFGVVTVLSAGRVVVPMAGLFDLDAERTRLQKQIAEAEGEVTRLEAKLGNDQFTARAPEQVVAKEQERLATARTRLEGLRQSLAEVG
ncbi:MAG: valine--tRNA ligase [Dehalococcoidia bacterium]